VQFAIVLSKAVVALFALGSLVASETFAKPIKYSARIGARYPSVADGGTVAVVNFSGPDGENFGNALASSLQSAEIDGKPVFTVRTNDSLNYRSTGDLSKTEVAAAIRAGQKLGAATVFTGVVTTASVVSNNYTREDSVCLKSSGFLKCESSGIKRVPCTKVVGTYSVTPRAIRVATGAMVFSETIQVSGEYAVCDGQLQGVGLGNIFGKRSTTERIAVTSPQALMEKMRLDAAGKVRLLVAPFNSEIEVNLKDRAPGLTKPDSIQFRNAVAFGNASRMDRACSIFEMLLVTDANRTNVPLLYNMGVCQEVLLPDKPGSALEYYARADQLLTKPDKDVSAAYLRMKALVGQSRLIK
jgi:hypothetical protein